MASVHEQCGDDKDTGGVECDEWFSEPWPRINVSVHQDEVDITAKIIISNKNILFTNTRGSCAH